MDDRTLAIRHADWHAVTSHLEGCLPEEGCGLLAGRGEQVELVIPIENIEHSPVHYRMEPRSLVSAMNRIEDLGLDLLAAFHSHPRGPAGVSSMDQAEWFYPESILMVLTRAGGAWSGRAFRLEGDRFREVRIAFQPD